MVATRRGRLDVESSVPFNLPELRVFILTDDDGASAPDLGPLLVTMARREGDAPCHSAV